MIFGANYNFTICIKKSMNDLDVARGEGKRCGTLRREEKCIN